MIFVLGVGLCFLTEGTDEEEESSIKPKSWSESEEIEISSSSYRDELNSSVRRERACEGRS